jgi:NAD(P)-dependent dehydrogenase (short-subunit alcohol dehydrogenase family)
MCRSDLRRAERPEPNHETLCFGRLDVLVNNAGVFEGGDPAEITNAQWRKVMATDLDGVFFGCRAALPHLQKTRGSIVTASVFRDRRRLGHLSQATTRAS